MALPDPPQSDSAPCPHCSEAHPSAYTHCPRTGKPLWSGAGLVGRVINGRYEVQAVIGEGGMGAVYLASHRVIGRRVAIKRLRPELAADTRAVRRFQREARAAAATGHHHIVDVLDLGYSEDGAPFLVMEYLRGRSLSSLLRAERALPATRTCRIVGQVLTALSAVHAQGILHRDLKPDNVFLTRRGNVSDYVKLLDFGISKIRTEEGEGFDLTRTGVMMGTPYYMSPEQARGSKTFDHRVDLYAAGVLLYECLTGRTPFEGENYHQLLQAILKHVVIPPSTLVADVPPGLDAIIERAIARDPADRYQSADELLAALVPFGATPAHEDAALPADPDDLAPVSRSVPPPAIPTVAAAGDIDYDALVERTVTPGPTQAAPTSDARYFFAASSDWDASVAGAPLPRPSRAPTRRARAAAAPRTPAAGSPARAPTPAAAAKKPTPAMTPSVSEPRLALDALSARVRSSLVTVAFEQIEQLRGLEVLASVRDGLDPAIRERLELSRRSAWIDGSLYDAVLRAAERAAGVGDGALALLLGEATARRELPASHRLTLDTTRPATAIERAPSVLRAYHGDLDARVEPNALGGHRLELLGTGSESFLRASAAAGFVRGYMALAGASEPRVSVIACRGRGDPRTMLAVRWTEA